MNFNLIMTMSARRHKQFRPHLSWLSGKEMHFVGSFQLSTKRETLLVDHGRTCALSLLAILSNMSVSFAAWERFTPLKKRACISMRNSAVDKFCGTHPLEFLDTNLARTTSQS